MYARLRVGLFGLVLALPLLSATLEVSKYPPAYVMDHNPLQSVQATLDRWLVALAPGNTSPAVGERLSLEARVRARSKMSPRVAAMAASADQRTLRLRVRFTSPLEALDSAQIAALGGRSSRVEGVARERLVDLPGMSLDRLALSQTVTHVSLVGVVARAGAAPVSGGR